MIWDMTLYSLVDRLECFCILRRVLFYALKMNAEVPLNTGPEVGGSSFLSSTGNDVCKWHHITEDNNLRFYYCKNRVRNSVVVNNITPYLFVYSNLLQWEYNQILTFWYKYKF
jgi:hypothetical protein